MTFSVVTPVYNAGAHIKECIDSVLAQTLVDWELILIDDGSQDNSGLICDSYSVADSRIKVIHTANGGAAAARNIGLDAVQGDYIVFLDSDDYIAPSYLADIQQEVFSHPVDVYLGSRRTDFDAKGIKRDVVLYDAAKASGLSLEDLLRYFFGPADDAPFATWHNVYLQQFIEVNRLRFDTSMIWSEDRDFLLKALSCRPAFHCMGVSGYCYRIGESSSVTAVGSSCKIIKAVQGDERWLAVAENEELFECARVFFAADIVGLLLRSLTLDDDGWACVRGYMLEHRQLLSNAALGGLISMLLALNAPRKPLGAVARISAKLMRMRRKSALGTTA